MAEETLTCPEKIKTPVGVRGLCGQDRDCLSFVGEEPGFHEAWCNGLAWVLKHPSRTYEIFALDASRPDFRMRPRIATAARVTRCHEMLQGAATAKGFNAAPDPFTVTVPGITDILRLPNIESKELRKERARRYRTANPILPEPLQWVPKVLNKLDDAQDLLFTALALSIPLLRFAVPRLLPFVGWLLTINDVLNLFT